MSAILSARKINSTWLLKSMKLAKEKGVNLVLATDTVAADAFDNNANTQIVPSMEIPDGWEGLDVGPESIASFTKVIEQSKNHPLEWSRGCI